MKRGDLFAQEIFNNFTTIQAAGAIPADFTTSAAQKVQMQIGKGNGKLSGQKEKIFLEGIHYGIDDLLHSGMVVYGDEVSVYVSKVAAALLKKKYSNLIKELRFYTIKSNECNAFSTEQGIVFVTTGLISQLANEAQLAFVLAHEIAHYIEHHVVDAYEVKLEEKDATIRRMSIYSKEREFEADKIGVGIYKDAGYSRDELVLTFDVLMYSYLPFDEVEFPIDYFNTDLLYVPEMAFTNQKYEIKAQEDYDDSQSSHPNIKSRKSNVLSEIKSMDEWGSTLFLVDESQFLRVRNLSRFERIRTDILDAHYVDALYSVFVMEKEFPFSFFLKRMKAHAWLGIAQYAQEGSMQEVIPGSEQWEGEIASLSYFLKKSKRDALTTIAMRQVKDVQAAFPANKEIAAIWDRMEIMLASSSLQLAKFSSLPFSQAVLQSSSLVASDSIAKEAIETGTKYSRIKQKKKGEYDGFDSTAYYLYALSDLVNDESFLNRIQHLKDSIKQKEEKSSELKVAASNKATNDYILVEPSAVKFKKGKVDHEGSDRLEQQFSSAIHATATDLDLTVYDISAKQLSKIGTLGFNERNTLTSFLLQLTLNDKIHSFPVDYSLLQQIITAYGTSKVMYTVMEHGYQPHFSMGTLSFILFPPAVFAYFTSSFLQGNRTEFNWMLVDCDKAIIEEGVSHIYQEPMSNLSLSAHLYDLLSNLKQK